MADWVHRTTKEHLISVSPSSLPEAEANYIENPDLSAVVGQPNKYWTVTGDVITLKDQGERDAVDAALDLEKTEGHRGGAIELTVEPSDFGVQTRALIELLNKRDNYVINRLTELQAALDAMKASVGNVGSLRDAIPASWLATNTRTKANAVADYTDDINAGNQDT